MDLTPKVALLKSFRGEPVNYQILIGEAVDNAFDASAQRVQINIGSNLLAFVDDGVGLDESRIEALFTPGAHVEMHSTALGRFGVGIKIPAFNAGDVLKVDSVSKDGRVIAVVNWQDLLKSNTWEAADPRWIPVAVGSPTGTVIEISHLRHPQKYTDEKIIEDLALRFFPALSGGRSITFNHVRVPVLTEPRLTDLIETNITLSDDRSAAVRGGILAEPSKLWGVHVAYKHRVILPKCTLGTGDYGGITKMFARVQLGGSWDLGRFKDQFVDEGQRDELETAVEAALLPILEKCEKTSTDARISHMGNLINKLLPPQLVPARPRRQKKGSEGATADRGRSKPRGLLQEGKSEPANKGPARKESRSEGRLQILLEGRNEEQGLGVYKPGRQERVLLSPDNAVNKVFWQHRDQILGATALMVVALCLYEEGRGAGKFPFEPFGKRLAELLALNQPNKEMKEA